MGRHPKFDAFGNFRPEISPFSLPQNMAAVASPAALLIGWGITGAGILLLAFAMLILTRIRPELDGGIFTYAREGFGELIGFCSAYARSKVFS